jgi:diaminopimelate decarboxylase
MVSQDILTTIANQYGTPSYVFDIDELTKRMGNISSILGKDIHLCYAMKANPFLVDAMKPLVAKYEVCSPGEFAICEREQIDMKRIVLSGVNKEKSDIEHVMDDCGGVGIYTVESINQFALLNECAAKRKIKISVLLRVTSGNQFGMDEEEIEHLISTRDQYEFIDFKGIQCYSGTQKKKFTQIENEIDWLDGICTKLQQKYGFQVQELEYGPGLAVSYFEPDTDNDHFEQLQQFSDKLNDIRGKYVITLEMGRYMAATCGIYLSRIADLKKNNGQNYCIIDGGINHLNYYGQTMAMKFPKTGFVAMNSDNDSKSTEEAAEPWTICGSLCTVADVIVKNLSLSNAQIGDMIIFYNVGAYSVTEGIYLFLSRKLPKILTYDAAHKENLIRNNLPTDVINSRNSQ